MNREILLRVLSINNSHNTLEWYSIHGQVQIDGNKLTVVFQLRGRFTLFFKLNLLSNNCENINISKIFD